MSRDEEAFERLAPPRKGEWRSLFVEQEQTFDDYAAACANRKSAARFRFLLQPLGSAAERHGAMFDRMREYAEAFFGLDARILDPLPLPGRAHVSVRDQHNSSMILDQLAGLVPAEALVFMGVADRDLFARGKNYVFGEGNLERRVGVCSLARLDPADPARFERRALKLLTHEAGHLLSIAHCTTRPCVMQGSNTLEESDGQPLSVCPVDLRKLEWNTGVDREERARKLREFWRS